MSILVSIKRIVQPWVILRRLSTTIAISFGFMWVILLAEKIWLCAPESSGMNQSDACMLKQPIPATDISCRGSSSLFVRR